MIQSRFAVVDRYFPIMPNISTALRSKFTIYGTNLVLVDHGYPVAAGRSDVVQVILKLC